MITCRHQWRMSPCTITSRHHAIERSPSWVVKQFGNIKSLYLSAFDARTSPQFGQTGVVFFMAVQGEKQVFSWWYCTGSQCEDLLKRTPKIAVLLSRDIFRQLNSRICLQDFENVLINRLEPPKSQSASFKLCQFYRYGFVD